jgi:hypothetical protein
MVESSRRGYSVGYLITRANDNSKERGFVKEMKERAQELEERWASTERTGPSGEPK